MDLYLASFPRSGSTLIRLLLMRHFGIQCPSIYGAETPLAPGMTAHLNRPVDADAPIVVWKTHDYPTERWPTIILVRDGRDVVVSYAHYMKSYEGRTEEIPELMREIVLREYDWSTFYNEWYFRLGDVPWAILRYEDLLEDPVECLGWILRDIGVVATVVNWNPLPPVDQYRADNPEFFRRGSPGAWRDEMPDDIQELFWQRHSAFMKVCGYHRDTFQS